jgi:cytochrome c nitrite reductase small subunit
MAEEYKSRNGPLFKRLGFTGGLAVALVGLAVAVFAMKTTDRRIFCGSCHVMNEAAWTHKTSSHANLACNECHAPANLAAKLPFKAVAGTRDILVNTFGSPDAIHTNQKTRDVVNANCRSCHAITNMNVASMEAKPYCTDCHRNVHHLRTQPISKRKVADG